MAESVSDGESTNHLSTLIGGKQGELRGGNQSNSTSTVVGCVNAFKF